MAEQENGQIHVPSPGQVADICANQQIASEPIVPLDYGIARVDGEPIHLTCVCFGPTNIDRLQKLLDRLKPHQDSVTNLPGES